MTKPRATDEPNLLEPEVSMLVRMPALILPIPKADRAALIDAAIAQARRTGDASAKIDGTTVYPFRAIAASDGLDSYFTKHDVADSLVPIAKDFSAGQSVLGNHDYGTFSMGSTFDGQVVDAEVDAPEYEAAFYRKYADDPRLVTTKWAVNNGYVVRGMTDMGAQASSDSVIRGMETGAIRKISISFTVGSYVCGIDGIDMLDGYWGAWPDEDAGCAHFPGIEYPEAGGIGFAVMHDTRALEESLVYKNASPSAMLLRKAEVMAAAGRIGSRDVALLEERFGHRLPSFSRSLFRGAAARKEEPTVAGKTTKTAAAEDPEDVDPTVTDPPTDPNAVDPTVADPPADPADDAADDEPEADASEMVTAISESAVELVALAGRSPDAIAPSHLTALYEAERSIDALLVEHKAPKSVAGDVHRIHETRDKLITDVLGRALTVEAIRTLKTEAEVGATMFAELVAEAVAARTGVQRELFPAEQYKKALLESHDVAFVKAELESWTAQKKGAFSAGRQVTPGQVKPDSAATTRKAPEAPAATREPADDNLLAQPRKER